MIELSLISDMNWFASGGRTRLSACGRTIQRISVNQRHAEGPRGFALAAVDGFNPGPHDFADECALEQRQDDNPGDDRRKSPHVAEEEFPKTVVFPAGRSIGPNFLC